MGLFDWLTGKRGKQQEIDASADQVRQEPKGPAHEHTPEHKAPVPVQRLENQPRPAERMLPHHSSFLQTMHDYPPPPPTNDQVATQMRLTPHPQAKPSMGGPGTSFIPPGNQSTWVKELEEAKREQAAAEASMTIEQKQKRAFDAALARKNSQTNTQGG